MLNKYLSMYLICQQDEKEDSDDDDETWVMIW